MNSGAATQASRAVNRFFEFSLLGMLAAGYFAVLGSGTLDLPTAVLTVVGLCVRGLMTAGVIRLDLPSRLVAALAIAYICFFPIDYYYLSGNFLGATVHMVFFLAVLKLLTAKTERDYGYLKLIAGLELIAAAILSVGLSFLLYLAVFLLCAIAALASGEVRRFTNSREIVSNAGMRKFSRRLGVLSIGLFAGILVLTGGLFFALPRTARAAFERLVPQRYRLPGFSNSVTLGEIGEIKQNSTPVMHVRSYQGEGFLPVKWRGVALNEFDGTRWYNPPGEERRIPGGTVVVRTAVQGDRQGRSLVYQVHLSPIISDTLFFAGNPETISVDVPFLRYSRNGSFHVPPRFGLQGLSYSVYGFLPDEWAEVRFTAAPLAESLRQELLSLPPIDARIPKLTQDMIQGAETEAQKARAIESHLRHDYGYTLELLSKPVADPLAYFLFNRKKGHCEYFASAMAVMLRSVGIPARVVTGFQSGIYNPITGWQMVRASDAHSWVEAWLEGRGWTTFDPTPADPSAGHAGLLSKLSLLSDAAQQFWQDWVMSYDAGRQMALASQMQARGRQFRLPQLQDFFERLKEAAQGSLRYIIASAAIFVVAMIAIIFGPIAAKRWRERARLQRMERGQGERSDATVLYERMLVMLEKKGVQKPAWLTPLEFVHVLPDSKVSELVADATTAYNELRFGGRTEAAPRMIHVLEEIEKL